jgi:hypothetical protein
MDKHDLPIFGQKTGMIFSTNGKENPYLFIRCLKKKANGDWEKANESKNVKLSLLEIVSIDDVLNKKKKLWTTFHSYNDVKTPISFSWDDHDPDLLWVNIDEYSRPINYPETELVKRLFNHIVDEKIEFATKNQPAAEKDVNEEIPIREEPVFEKKGKVEVLTKKNETQKEKETINDFQKSVKKNESDKEETTIIHGKIKMNRDKAILIILDNNDELWLPKSTIVGNFDNNNDVKYQDFQVKKWILEKRSLNNGM